jgi:hypothetical protein
MNVKTQKYRMDILTENVETVSQVEYNLVIMDKTKKIAIILGFMLFLGYVVYSSLGLNQFRCEVCVEFHGQTACATASGSTREEAQRTATDTACGQVSSGMTDTMACGQIPPKSIRFK